MESLDFPVPVAPMMTTTFCLEEERRRRRPVEERRQRLIERLLERENLWRRRELVHSCSFFHGAVGLCSWVRLYF